MQINFKLIRSNRSTLSLYVQKNGEVLVKAPLFLPMQKIYQFVDKKSEWIVKKQQLALMRYSLLPTLNSGEKIQILGEIYQIELCEIKRAVVGEGKLILPSENAKQHLKAYCLKEFKQYITQRVQAYAMAGGILINGVRISCATKRWGSCSAENKLSFNLSLCLLPKHLIDYVILHELCHVFEKNHSERFYALIVAKMPDYKKRVQELKGYSAFCDFFSKV